MTLNNCASMKLEVHFQCKQVRHGNSGEPKTCTNHLESSSSVLGVWGIQSSALFQTGSGV